MFNLADIVEALMRYCNSTIENRSGQTPLQLAEEVSMSSSAAHILRTNRFEMVEEQSEEMS
jgi:hypothetical protein